MRCPYCGFKVSLFSMLKVSRWSNYICPECEEESNRTTLNVVTVYCSLIIFTYAIKWLLTYADIYIGNIIDGVTLFSSLFLFEGLLGRLVKIEKPNKILKPD